MNLACYTVKYSLLNWPIILHVLTERYNQLHYWLLLCNWNAKHISHLKQKHLIFKDAHVPSLKSDLLIFDLYLKIIQDIMLLHFNVCCIDSFSLFLVFGFTVKALYCFIRQKLMSLKMTMVLTSLHMDLTYQEKEQVDAISINVMVVKCLLPLWLAFKKQCFSIIE